MPGHNLFGGEDIGWAGAFVPMIVSETTLAELRNMAGPPQYPGQRRVEVDLVTGMFQWKKRTAARRFRRTRGRR